MLMMQLLHQLPSKQIYRFAVYELPIVDAANNLGNKRYIVIKNQYGIVVRFTGLEQYSNPFTGKKQPIRTRTRHELEYICNALNCIFFDRIPANNATSLARIPAEVIFAYFEHYRTEPMNNGNFRGQQSIDNCVRAVSCFFANASLAAGAIAAIEPTELFQETYIKANREARKVVMKYQPLYQEKALQSRKHPIFRDIPLAAMETLWDVCRIHSPEIYFAVVAQCTAGLRPSEVMNIRREDSPLSRGLSITMRGSTITKIEIDLRQEMLLRSDGKSVGKIKRERIQPVYPAYIPLFYEAYQRHLLLMRGRKYENDYAPMFINQSGKAMTYKSYEQKFQYLVHNCLRPKMLQSEEPELQVFAHRLATEKFSPHALRHFFTVSLVLRGEGIAQIQYYRGDTSPESALLYLKNKGELVKAAEMAHAETLEGLFEVGEKANARKL